MRPILAILVAAIVGVGLSLFLRSQKPTDAAPLLGSSVAEGDFGLAITLTFDAGPDPFALDADSAPSLTVEHHGKLLLRETESLPAGKPIRIDNVEGIVDGQNTFYVRCTAQNEEAFVARAIRVEVLRDDQTIAEETLWSDPGKPVRGPVNVEVKRAVDTKRVHDE